MPIYFVKNKQRWRFTFNRVIEGQRHRATKLLPAGWSRTQAEAYDRTETARLYAVAAGLNRPEPLIAQAVELYLEHRIPNLRNGKHAAQDLAWLVEYIDGRPISQLPDVAREYRRDHPELAAATVRNRLAYLKAACRYAWKKHGLTEHDPTAGMELPAVHNARDVQTPVKRLRQLLEAINDRETRALYTLAFRIGSRWISGVHRRKPEDIVRSGADVWLRIGITKNGQPRMKWVHPDARWALRYIPFRHSPTYYYDRFRAARAAVGLDSLPGGLQGLRAHDMRHIVATDILKRQGSLGDVGAALDHESYAASARYAHIVPEHIKRVLAMVGGKKMHTARRRRGGRRAA